MDNEELDLAILVCLSVIGWWFFLNLPLFRFFTTLGQATFLQNKVGT